jgi:CelD/BcsL family acetyltransferase involved in cellulose biosynthesis
MSCTWTEAVFPPSHELEQEWNALLERGGAVHVQRRPWYLRHWMQHFGEGRATLHLLRDGDELLAVLPMSDRKVREAKTPLPRMVRGVVGDGFADMIGLALREDLPDVVEAVRSRLEELRAGVDELRLTPLITGRPDGCLVPLLEQDGWECLRIEGNPLLDLAPGWEELSRRVGKNLRRDVAKKKRRLDEEGIKPVISLLREADAGLIDRLTALAQLRFDAEQHKSAFLDEARRAFLLDVSQEASRRGVFACFMCHDGDRLMGYRFGFLDEGVFHDWITSYDPYYFQWSIGKLLLWDIIDSLCQMKVLSLDFMAGEEEYKLKWLPEVRDMWLCRSRNTSMANIALKTVQGISRLRKGKKS